MFNKVSIKEKMLFAQHLSLLIKGERPLFEALKVLRNETKSGTFKKVLNGILNRVSEGISLNQSLRAYPQIFDKFFCNVVKVGEVSGTLSENLKYLSQYLRNQYLLQKKIVLALIYPLLILILTFFLILLLLLFVLPKIIGLFRALQVELPWATRVLINTSIFLKNNGIKLIVIFLFLFLVFKLLNRNRIIKFYSHKLLLSLPALGKVSMNVNLARFSRTFYTLFKSGVPVLEALEVCQEVLQNAVYKERLKRIQYEVERGERLSEALKKFPDIFPPIFAQMILVGEKGGTLEESLRYLAEFYEEEVDSAVKNLSGLIEPFLLILVGVVVAFVVLSIITPIYRLVGNLSHLPKIH